MAIKLQKVSSQKLKSVKSVDDPLKLILTSIIPSRLSLDQDDLNKLRFVCSSNYQVINDEQHLSNFESTNTKCDCYVARFSPCTLEPPRLPVVWS